MCLWCWTLRQQWKKCNVRSKGNPKSELYIWLVHLGETLHQLTLFSKVEVDFSCRQVGRENCSVGQLKIILSVVVIISCRWLKQAKYKINGLFHDERVSLELEWKIDLPSKPCTFPLCSSGIDTTNNIKPIDTWTSNSQPNNVNISSVYHTSSQCPHFVGRLKLDF